MKRLIVGIIFAAALIAARAEAGELVQNGGFETGSFSGGWVHGAGNFSGNPTNPTYADHLVVLDAPHGGNYSALIGFKYAQPRVNHFGFFYQDVAIPTNISRATLFFAFRQQGYDGSYFDPFRMQIRDTANDILATVMDYSFAEVNHLFKDSGWRDDDDVIPIGRDMTAYAGQIVRLYFYQENSFNNFYETWACVDDVSLMYRRWVDLAVDGAGDDLFGAAGTGSGGYSARSGEAGDTLAYFLDIENEGLDADSYRLSVGLSAGWSASIRYGGSTYAFPWTTPAVPAGSTIRAEVVVVVPAGAAAGGYSTIVDAVSTAQANRYDSVRLATNVVPAHYLADLIIDANGHGVIDPSGGGGISYRETAPNTMVAYALDLHNDGASADSFRIDWATPSPLTADVLMSGIVRTGAFSSGLVPSGGSTSFTYRVYVPASLLGGDYSSIVRATSLSDTLKRDAVRAVTRVFAPKVDVVICGSGNDIIDPTGAGLGGSVSVAGTRGTTVYFPIVIQNEGAVADSFTVSWVPPASGWTASIIDNGTTHALPWRTPTMAPRSERSCMLVVTISSGAAYDTFASIFNFVSAVSSATRESVKASISVATGNEIDLFIDGNGDDVYGSLGTGLGGSSVKTASPGEVVSFAVTIQNEVGEDLFDIWWNTPPGWEVRIGDSTSTMRGVSAGAYTMTVSVPTGCVGGTFDVIVDGRKTNKRYFIDSVLGRVSVTPPRIVDALIDGNGDEMFGGRGTGAGGSSLQSTIAGRTVAFALELQNQGPESESYRVSWNAAAGMIATLDGGTSPFTTAPVAPGDADLLAFVVRVPLSTPPGDYNYIIDVVSTLDSTNSESVQAGVLVNAPPRADLIINGDGAFVTALPGSGDGGSALVFGAPGTMATATLELWNRGGYPDTFRVSWTPPAGWPAGSIILSDDSGDHGSPYDIGLIQPGAFRAFTVTVYIPAYAALRTPIIIDGIALSRDLEDSITLEIGTGSFVAGVVFDDRDHDGVLDIGEDGWVGVSVALAGVDGTLTQLTGGDGSFFFEAASGVARTLVETTPPGMISLSPDTALIGAVAAGETLRVDFADVRGPAITPPGDLSCVAGGFVDVPHIVTAGTAGQAALSVAPPPGWVAVVYRDNDGDGTCGPGDSLLTPADLALDPDIPGRDVVLIVMRVFVPPQVPAGTVGAITVTLAQTLAGTAITAEASLVDRILVLASSSGLLALTKTVDLAEARPGDILTYSITYTNPGVEAVREIEIIDLLPPAVEIVLDAFGAGQDVEWLRDGAPVYLTVDPGDADEAMFDALEGTLSVVLSRRAPYLLESGASGSVTYRVRVR